MNNSTNNNYQIQKWIDAEGRWEFVFEFDNFDAAYDMFHKRLESMPDIVHRIICIRVIVQMKGNQ